MTEYRDPLSIDGLHPDRVKEIPVEKFQNKEYFFTSMIYVFHAFIMIFSKGLWKVFLVQYLFFMLFVVGGYFVNGIVFGIVYGVGFATGVQTLSYVWCGVFVLVFAIIFVLSIFYGYQLNDCQRRVSEKTELIMKNANPDPLFECWHCSETCGTYCCVTFWTGLVEFLVIFIYILLFMFVFMWIPVVSTVVPFLFQVLASGYYAFKVVFVRKGDYFGMFKYIIENYQVFFGFGVALALFSHIPLLGKLEVFIGAVGFTQFYLHHEYFKTKDAPTDTSALIPPSFGGGDDMMAGEEEEVGDDGVGYQAEEDDLKSSHFEGPPVEEGPSGYGNE